MKKARYLLRFVDVVLILLFGFIVISDMDEDSQIVLPISYEAEFNKPEMEVFLFIGVTSTGQLIDERMNTFFNDVESLRPHILRHKNRFGEFAKVRIRANYDTPTKYVIELAKLCDDLSIPKSIDVQLTGR